MAEVDEIIAEAEEANESGEWIDALLYYNKAIRLLDERNGVRDPGERAVRMSEEDKHAALDCWVALLRCKIEVFRADSEILLYDVGGEIDKEIRGTEREIKGYGIRNKIYLWNTLQRAYDQWGDERRDQGRKNEADALQHHALKARMKRDFWRVFGQPLLPDVRIIRSVFALLESLIRHGLNAVGNGILWTIVVLHRVLLIPALLESWIRYGLDTVSKGLVQTIAVFIFAPIVVFAAAYWSSGTVTFVDNEPLPAGLEGFLHSLRYSIGTFTGTGSSDLTPHCSGLWLTSLEAIMACVFIAVALGYIVNRLSSR
jgi:hypothetical protein